MPGSHQSASPPPPSSLSRSSLFLLLSTLLPRPAGRTGTTLCGAMLRLAVLCALTALASAGVSINTDMVSGLSAPLPLLSSRRFSVRPFPLALGSRPLAPASAPGPCGCALQPREGSPFRGRALPHRSDLFSFCSLSLSFAFLSLSSFLFHALRCRAAPPASDAVHRVTAATLPHALRSSPLFFRVRNEPHGSVA